MFEHLHPRPKLFRSVFEHQYFQQFPPFLPRRGNYGQILVPQLRPFGHVDSQVLLGRTILQHLKGSSRQQQLRSINVAAHVASQDFDVVPVDWDPPPNVGHISASGSVVNDASILHAGGFEAVAPKGSLSDKH